MDLSPNDIRNYEFASQMRGYAKEEVDDFREKVAVALEGLKQENLKLSMENESLKTQLAGLRQFEETIKNAAIDARRNADMTIANAKKEAELIISRARTEAESILGSRAKKVSEIEDQIAKLELAKKSYLAKLRNLITSHLQVLDEVAREESAPSAKNDLEVTDSTEVSRQKLETLVTPPSKSEPIKTEEANAVEHIIPTPAPEATPSESEPAAAASEQSSSEHPVDPELAAALEKYQRKEPPPIKEQPSPPTMDAPPAPGQIVETTARAEDIPNGFITPEMEKTPPPDDTDKIALSPDAPEEATEHNAISIDQSTEPAPAEEDISPEKLAQELDRVVAKFEEEMDKAEKS